MDNFDYNMWISKKIDELLNGGFIDSFRSIVKEGEYYSWWSNCFNARQRNMGWRIDYIFLSKIFEKGIKSVKYLKEQYGSDHCPYLLDVEIGKK